MTEESKEKKAFVDVHWLARRYGVTPGTVKRWAKADRGFPRPVEIGDRCVRWVVGDIVAFEQEIRKRKDKR